MKNQENKNIHILLNESSVDLANNSQGDSVFYQMLHIDEVVKCTVFAKTGKAPGFDEILT